MKINKVLALALIASGSLLFGAEAGSAPSDDMDIADISNKLSKIDTTNINEGLVSEIYALIQKITLNQDQQKCIIKALELKQPANLFEFLMGLSVSNTNAQLLDETLRLFGTSVINQQNKDGASLLTYPAINGSADIIQILINAGIDRGLAVAADTRFKWEPINYLRFGMNCSPSYAKAFRLLYRYYHHDMIAKGREAEIDTPGQITAARGAYAEADYCKDGYLSPQLVLKNRPR